ELPGPGTVTLPRTRQFHTPGAARRAPLSRPGRYAGVMARSAAERQRAYRARKKQAQLAAVPAPDAPAESALGAAGRQLWNEITGEYELAQHEQAMLLEACRCRDRLDAIADELQKAPLTV